MSSVSKPKESTVWTTNILDGKVNITVKDIVEDRSVPYKLMDSVKFRVKTKTFDCGIPHALPEPIHSMVREHFDKSGEGYVDMS